MTKDKALKMALEALESPWNAPYVDGCDLALGKKVKAITAINEALAQTEQDGKCKYCTDGCPACDASKLPEQEPVAWAKFSAKGNIIDLLNEPDNDYTPLYTTPPQRTWVGLTEDEADKIYKDGNTFGEMMRMVEAKLKEKNS
jgi:hypothetical protein